MRSQARSARRRRATKSPTGADGTRQSSTYRWSGNSSSGRGRTANVGGRLCPHTAQTGRLLGPQTVEGVWRQYKDAFVEVAEELCGRTSGKGGTPRSRNQGWWTEEVAKAVGEKGKASDMIECIKKQRGPTNHQLKSPVWPEEEGSQEGGGHSTEEYGRRTVPKA